MRLLTNHAKIAATHYGPGDEGMAQAAQELALTDDVFLADVFVQDARVHAGGQRRLLFHALLLFRDLLKLIDSRNLGG